MNHIVTVQDKPLIKHNVKSTKKRQYVAYLYILPWIIGFLVFQLLPFVSSLWYSFTDYSLFKPANFVGLNNYIKIFTNDNGWLNSLMVTFKYVLIEVPSKLIFALFIAVLLNMKIRGVNFFRTAYYMPSILGGSVSIAILWRFLFMRNGVVNSFTAVIGIPAVDWLGDPSIALYILSLLSVWQFGSSMVIFLAGLKQIPPELYEAATVDGAGKPRMFFSITLPMLSPMIFFNLIMQMVNAFQQFTGAFVVTNGGPAKSTYLYGMLLYENAFKHFKMGYAAAQSWILFIIIMLMTIMVFRFSSYWTFYEDGGDFF